MAFSCAQRIGHGRGMWYVFEENKNFDKCSHVSLRKREEEKNSKESDGEVNSNFDTQNKILGVKNSKISSFLTSKGKI